jgi:hypothetical protein
MSKITNTSTYCGEGIWVHCTVIIPDPNPPDIQGGYAHNIQQAEDPETFDNIERLLLQETRLPAYMVDNLLLNTRNFRTNAYNRRQPVTR